MLLIRTALALGLAGFATAAHADVLIDNVSGITIGEDGEIDRFTGLWIDDDGRIKQVLDKGDRRPAKTDFRYDGEGRTVIPGMIDAHAHVMGLGIAELTLDLSNTRSLDEALAEIARFARENPSRPWILGRGWNQEQWGLGRFPTAAELDRAVADRPVYLERVDGHAGWANSEAIKRAGVTAATKDPEGGRIERIAGSKTPSGVFVDLASELFTPVIPAPRPAERDLALMEAQEKLLSNGITAVADMGTTMADWLTFRRVADRGNLKVRIMSYASDPETMEMIGGAGERPWLYGDRLRMNGLKIYLDGALGSRGAWLKRPYADDPGNTGLPLIEPTRFRNVLSRAALGGYQVAIHAIGDAANGEALAAMAELKESFPGDTRWRIEHAQIVDPADLPAFGANGIIASMQPVHQTSDRLMAESRLDPARLEGAYAWRTVLDTGGKLAFGSDAPVESPNPFAGLAAAISRTGADGQPEGGWYPQQAVSRKEALAGFTSDAAYAGFAEGRFGKLVAGERADFVIVDRDPLAANPQDLRQTRVIQVWMDGEPVWGYTAK